MSLYELDIKSPWLCSYPYRFEYYIMFILAGSLLNEFCIPIVNYKVITWETEQHSSFIS